MEIYYTMWLYIKSPKTGDYCRPGSWHSKAYTRGVFGKVHEEEKPPKYQWSGILILLVKNETFKKDDETKGLFSRFFHLLLTQKS